MSRLLLLIVPNSSKASFIRWTRVSLYLFTGFYPPYKWWELYISCSRLTFSVTVRQIASPGRHPWSLFPIYNSQSIGGRRCGLCGTYLRVRVGILSRLSQRAPWSLCLINAAVTHQKLDFSLFLHSPPFPQFQEGLYVCSDCSVGDEEWVSTREQNAVLFDLDCPVFVTFVATPMEAVLISCANTLTDVGW